MKIHQITYLVLIVGLIYDSYVLADIYLHNPRGSNNRLDEKGRERNNANRMFNSQNNQRGGYNVGYTYYQVGSLLQIEWTNQHSCKNPNANCEIILQYMCSDLVRDGSDTKTIPESNQQCANEDCSTDFVYGMHEDYNYYQNCKLRSRNKGLFTADQVLRDRAIHTRQNPNGERYAYECPEERDYYPYWHPTKWIDIAILTNDVKRCKFYQEESQNVKSRWYCSVPSNFNSIIPINKDECEKITDAKWLEAPAHNVEAPRCQETQFTRDNYLGNTYGGYAPVYNWTIPNTPNDRCVLRIRYNISTNDYDRDNTFAQSTNILNTYNLNQQDAIRRGYVFKNNPKVSIFANLNFTLNLAINTAQYGRVFQDRSHTFSIRKRTVEDGKRIINLNVRGKRGNIVQVYPAVEYDYVPNKIEISADDYIHFQWTGSNTNPPNNDGQGLQGTDRSNIIMLKERTFDSSNKNPFIPLDSFGHYALNYPKNILNTTFLGLSTEDLTKLALLDANLIGPNMDELDEAATYFDMGPKKITSAGVVHYMCTRNNNFSNRDQKGQIVSFEHPFSAENIGNLGGNIRIINGEIKVPEGSLNDLTYIRVDIKNKDHILKESKILSNQESIYLVKSFDDESFLTDFIILNPVDQEINAPFQFKINLKRSVGSMESLNVFRINSDFTTKTKIDSNIEGKQVVTFETKESGIYVVNTEKDYSLVIGLCVAAGLLVVLVGAIGAFFVKNPRYITRLRYMACDVKRSMQDEL